MNKEIYTWDQLFMNIVYEVSKKSKDPSIQVGAVIVNNDKQIVTTGFNGIPRKVDDNIKERYKRPKKYYYFEHAERNAIYQASMIGISLKNCTMYINLLPCADCARGIIQSGIKEVVVFSFEIPERWKESCNIGKEMLEEARIKIRLVNYESHICK